MSTRPDIEMTHEASGLATGAEMESDMRNMPAPIRLKRRLNVCISGTLSTFGMSGPTAATWKPVDGKHVEVFGIQNHEGVCLDHTSMTNALRNAIILKATILEQQNSFPVPLGVSMSCITPEESTELGEKYVCTSLANTTNTNPQVVFETDANSNESIEWRNKYPNYNASNLEEWGVLEVSRCPYVFVDQNHPVIALLRANKELLGADIDQTPKVDDQWHKVSRQVFKTCCNTLRTKVLSRIATRDLNSFSVQLHRLQDREWGDLDEAHALASFHVDHTWQPNDKTKYTRQHFANLLNTPYAYTARIELEYEIQP